MSVVIRKDGIYTKSWHYDEENEVGDYEYFPVQNDYEDSKIAENGDVYNGGY